MQTTTIVVSAAGCEFQLLSCVHMMNNGQMKEGKCLTGLLVVQLGRVLGLKLPQNEKHVNAHQKMNIFLQL